MGIFDQLFGKREKVSKPVYSQRQYAAAQAGRLFADFNGSERSADSELRPVINRMRARSRDLARNNEYAKRYLSLLKTNVVGERGYTLQVKAMDTVGRLDQVGNSAAEKAFRAWGRTGRPTVDGRMSWVDVQKLAIESLARDGEVILIKHRSAKFHDSYALQFIEPDMLDDQKNEHLPNGNEIRMGVELDPFGRPVAYHFLTYHPGDYDFSNYNANKKHKRVPADQVIHAFLPLRAGQTRGEPWLSPAIPALKQLGAFREAAVINARIGASKMGFITTPAGDGFMADDMVDGTPTIQADPGTFHVLARGQTVEKFDTAFPSNEFDPFHKAVLRGVASGLGVSYTSLANDLEATSYSSIRQGALEDRDNYKLIQRFMLDHVILPAYEGWLAAAMELNSFGIPVRQYDRFLDASEFRARGWSWVDPQKEMSAAVTGMKAGVLSLQDVAAQYGKDVEELLAQIQRDKALMDEFGIKYALEPYGAQQMPVAPIIDEETGEVMPMANPQAAPAADPSPQAEDQGIQAPDKLMNGAQVASIIEVVTAYSTGIIGLESAVEILIVGFGVAEDKAKKIVGGAAQGVANAEV